MVTSGVAGEGKSTTAANLAVALARACQRVVLVDFDLRRPFLHKFFDLQGPGATQVAIGSATVEEALVPISLVWTSRRSWNGGRNESRQAEGMLEVMPAGPMPPNVDEVLATHAVAGVLEDLRQRADIVLVDSPPLGVGDAMSLTSVVDAVLIVTRMNTVRRPMLRELRRVLDAIPAQKIGFAATGAGSGDNYSTSVGYRRTRSREREQVV